MIRDGNDNERFGVSRKSRIFSLHGTEVFFVTTTPNASMYSPHVRTHHSTTNSNGFNRRILVSVEGRGFKPQSPAKRAGKQVRQEYRGPFSTRNYPAKHKIKCLHLVTFSRRGGAGRKRKIQGGKHPVVVFVTTTTEVPELETVLRCSEATTHEVQTRHTDGRWLVARKRWKTSD